MTEKQLLNLLAEHGAQTRWARRLGVNPRTVRNWVQGRKAITEPTLRTAELWLRAEALVQGIDARAEGATGKAQLVLADYRIDDPLERLRRFLEADGEPRDRSAAA